MSRIFKISNVFYKFLGSYILILIIPVTILGSIYYVKSMEIVTRDIKDNNMAMLEQTVQMIDFRSRESDKLLSEIIANRRILNLMNSTAPLDSEKRMTIFDIMGDLSMYGAANNFIDYILLYSARYDIFITRGSMYTSDIFYQFILIPQGDYYERWHELLKGDNSFIFGMKLVHKGMPEEMAVYFRNLHGNNKLIFMVDMDKYRDIFDELVKQSHGYYYMADENGNILLTNDADGRFTDFVKENALEKGFLQKGDMLAITEISSDNNFRYTLMIPSKVFTAEIESIKAYTMLILVVCLFFGILTAFLMANRNYLPIKRILNHVKGSTQIVESGRNEFDMIENILASSLNEISTLKETLTNQMPILRSNFLSDLIKGRIKSLDEMEKQSGFLGLDLNFSWYKVVLLHIRKEKAFNSDDIIRNSVLNLASADLVEKYINRHYKGYAIELENGIVALVMGHQQPEGGNISAIEAVRLLRDYLDKNIQTDILIGISCRFDSLKDIGKAYNQAERALNHCIVKGKDITEFGELEQASDIYRFSIEQALQLSNYLKVGDEDSAEELIDAVFRENMEEKELRPEEVSYLLFDINNVILKTIREMDIDIGESDRVDESVLKEDAKAVFSKFKENIRAICGVVRQNRENKNKKLISEVLGFINDNISDCNLSLESVAERFDRTSKYLSRVFKEEMNCNFLDYINSRRVELAKEYLKTQNISDVYIRSGFSSISTFMRVFKKYTGITPGQYRETLRSG